MVSSDANEVLSQSTEAVKQQQQGDSKGQQQKAAASGLAVNGEQVEESNCSQSDLRDPAAKDGEGWPRLLTVAMDAANSVEHPAKEAAPGALDGSSNATTAAGKGGSSMDLLDELLASCKDVNLKGPGGFTALHMACLGQLTAAQRK